MKKYKLELVLDKGQIEEIIEAIEIGMKEIGKWEDIGNLVDLRAFIIHLKSIIK